MNITIRNIPEEVIRKIRRLAEMEKRSINNEILLILEHGVEEEVNHFLGRKRIISKETQINIWKRLSNEWDDERSTAEIIEDIYSNRTIGREVEL